MNQMEDQQRQVLALLQKQQPGKVKSFHRQLPKLYFQHPKNYCRRYHQQAKLEFQLAQIFQQSVVHRR